jgi:hypothetical protein
VEFWTAKKTTICRTFGGLLQDWTITS